jgi:hypothetical protein
MLKELQDEMFHEMKQKDIFRQAQIFAFDYADRVFQRHVYPTPDAIADVDQFVEKLPESVGNAADVLEKLNRYGTPASIAKTGGRYFGFVSGSSKVNLLWVAMIAISLAMFGTALRMTNVLPGGSLVTGACKVAAIDKRFQQPESMVEMV